MRIKSLITEKWKQETIKQAKIRKNSDNFCRENKERDSYGIKDEFIRIKLNSLQSFLMQNLNEKVGKEIYNIVYDICFDIDLKGQSDGIQISLEKIKGMKKMPELVGVKPKMQFISKDEMYNKVIDDIINLFG